MFTPSEGERLEEMAAYSSAPVRAAARLVVAIQAHRAASRARPAPDAAATPRPQLDAASRARPAPDAASRARPAPDAASRARPAPEAATPARPPDAATPARPLPKAEASASAGAGRGGPRWGTKMWATCALVAAVSVAAVIAAVVVPPGTPTSSAAHVATMAGATSGGGTATAGEARPAAGSASVFGPAATPSTVDPRLKPTRGAQAPELAAPLIAPGVPVKFLRDPLPVGKGIWITPSQSNTSQSNTTTPASDPHNLVAQAVAAGLTHLFVMAGSSAAGFNAAGYLGHLLPAAHAAGLRVVAWDSPSLVAPAADVARAHEETTFTTTGGQRVDGLAVDFSQIRFLDLGSAPIPAATAAADGYAAALRQTVGTAYPLIAAVPAPVQTGAAYPYAGLLGPFDAVAPLLSWSGGDPTAAMQASAAALAAYGKPELAVGLVADPTPAQVGEFVGAADRAGAVGISLRSPPVPAAVPPQPAGQALTAAPQFDLTNLDPSALLPSQIRAFQAELASLGFPVPLTGVLDQATSAALAAYQQAAKLEPTGVLTQATQALLLAPLVSILP
jgi:hypothetical protein